MFLRHHSDKLIYPLLLVVFLIIISYRPNYRLNPEMPKSFYSLPAGQKHTPEQKIAWAYWESAQMDIQWKFPHGHPLPLDPPAEFHVHAEALGPAAGDPATRALYWRRLQGVWNTPDAWKRQYEWDLGWASDPLTSAGEWLRDRVARWFTLPN